MSRFNIGIDTGGTYTDAVVVDLDLRQVIAAAKAITTHGDLSMGVSDSLRQVLGQLGAEFPRHEVSLVSVSTTLATNALVEGQGAAVATILIGFDDGMAARTRIAEAVPDAHIVRIDGGHSHCGEERERLDEDAVNAAVDAIRNQVEAYAVAAHYSVRNASHEHRAQEIIRAKTGATVTVSSDLSDQLDGPKRALTATLNARIISRIETLIAAVRRSLAQENIDARLMIVKGDGSLATADLVTERPIETILSGPAASVIGARYLSDRRDFIVADIGGTTTDIAIARNGWPSVSEKGSVVGDYRTLVRAVDMRTVGLGGDSEVQSDYKSKLSLSGNRVVPVSLLGARWPHIDRHLRSVLHAGKGMRTACRFVLRPEGFDRGADPVDLSAAERSFLGQLGDRPVAWTEVVHRVSDERRVLHLASRGLLQLAGFTPSDAAHVSGGQSQWSVETARLAAQIVGRSSGLVSRNRQHLEAELQRLAAAVHDAVVAKSSHLILERLAGQVFADDDPLVAAVTSGDAALGDLAIALTPGIPLIAVGGPAGLYYPDVGKRLSAAVAIPQHSAVANAIGAATGMIRVRASVEITAREEGGFLIHAEDEPLVAATQQVALSKAGTLVHDKSERKTRSMGAISTEVTIEVKRIDIPDAAEENNLMAATVTAECTGNLM